MNPTDSQYKEIIRLYPKIRIPYLKEAAYYLWQLAKTDSNIGEIIDNFQDCFKIHGDVTSYKMKKFDSILKYFKEDNAILDVFNNALLPSNESLRSLYPKSFGNWKEDKMYVSVDMNAANWSVFSRVAGFQGQKWESYVTEHFDLHPFLAKSKSFRQFILGNMNPNRQQSFQKEFMIKLAERYVNAGVPAPVCLSADELIFEFNLGLYTMPEFNDLEYGIKIKHFTIEVHDSFNERVLIKNFNEKRELFSIHGSRFFMHYKTLILNEDIEENDLYFEPEPKRLAKWII